MKNISIFLSLILFANSHAGTITLKVSGTAGLKGTAIVVNELLKDGSKRTKMQMTLRNSLGQSVMLVQESMYELTGVPRTKLQTTTIEGRSETRVVARFEKTNIELQSTTNGKTTQTTIPIPSGNSITEKFEFWFLRDQIGYKGESTFFRFDLVTLSFEKTRATYLGRRTIRVGKKRVKAHLVEVGDSKIYLDNLGDPYKIQSPGVVMERVQ